MTMAEDPAIRPLRVVVVDDSAFNRRTIAELLAAIPKVEVVGKAADGEQALPMVLALEPDLVTLDLEMPRMDGFTFLKLLMARRPTPVLVVSGRGAKADVFKALELGALDFIVKPSSTASAELASIRSVLEEKVAMVRALRPIGTRAGREGTATGLIRMPHLRGERPSPAQAVPHRVVLIGASTGGPPALVDLFSRLPSDLEAAVVVAQHMPERFTRTFAERLERLGGLRVAELDNCEMLRAGRALVCPGGRSTEIARVGDAIVARVVGSRAPDRYVPSVDRLFRTGASVLGPRAVGVILTGMGDDGTQGAAALKQNGGTVIAESSESAAIFGMPGSAIRAGVVDRVLALSQIADAIAALCNERRATP